MSLITQRPKHFNNVIGQDRALKVLRAVLKSERFLLRGFIFEGVRGVGKTSVAYLTARALMCTGRDSEGCGTCPSCKTIDTQGIDAHPDFVEIAAAAKPGVDAARDIVATAESLPVLGKRRIVMADEAHCLSQEAWKVYLKPLELVNNDAIYMFVTNQGKQIPDEIRGRCCRPKFGKMSDDTLLGFLVNVATANQIQYELDALKAISRAAKGIVRDALGVLDVCAAMGTVTKELVLNTMDDDLEDTSMKIYAKMAERDQVNAVKIADDACKVESPVRLIESLFATYAKCVYRPESPEQIAIRDTFRDVCGMTQIFLKWTTPQQLAADVVPLLVVELMSLGETRLTGRASRTAVSSKYNKTAPVVAPETLDGKTFTVAGFIEATGANPIRS